MPFRRRTWLSGCLCVCALLAAARAPAAPPGAIDNPRPDPASVVRYGPAYRYPQSGWIVLHVEGAPYERGYQHGRLMAHEIVETIETLAAGRGPKAPAEAWRLMRNVSNAMFLRRYGAEYLEEMRGIADGAAAAGAKFDDRPIDLVDIVTVNCDIETEFLEAALGATATGLEGRRFDEPPVGQPRRKPEDHCSAFAATGPATADGKIVFGHITMFQLFYVPHYNVWLDVQPKAGQRVVMQSFPGGIMSGLDYYINDAGILICETTIEQTAFEMAGAPVASRIRQAAQYAKTIDEAIDYLCDANNGLYTNEWLLADINTNEIAMFELGTAHTRLWRSSRNEWFGGTKGFYWGCNNTKDLRVRSEMLPTLKGKPGNLVFQPSDRDRQWQRLFAAHEGKIDAEFGFTAFTTPPLAAAPSCDAKFTTTALAKELKSWAMFGNPLGATWQPTPDERKRWADIQPLVSNDWALLTVDPPARDDKSPTPVDLKRDEETKTAPKHRDDEYLVFPAAWHGTLLPAGDADVWLAAAFSDFEKIVALEHARTKAARGKPLDETTRDEIELARFVPWSKWRSAERRLGRAVALEDIRVDGRTSDWYDVAAGKGTMLLSALRTAMGSTKFDEAMDRFGRANAGKEITTQAFIDHMAPDSSSPLRELFARWLSGNAPEADHVGNPWTIDVYRTEPERTMIVYGTLHDVYPQREAAEMLQKQIARNWYNFTVPIRRDDEVTDDELKNHHVLLVGRPATNALTARWAKTLPVKFGAASFEFRGKTYAHPASSTIAAGDHPLSQRHTVVVFAGLSGDATWHVVQQLPLRDDPSPQTIVNAAHRGSRRFGAERFAVNAADEK
ncbi:MAG TPA: C45 family autoproteolytic acyltransferase/hydrolase [Pirellulales bacterium]|nr:C45 family autoproteolytic acyltransferase/hydrolase [Pirellulales bacterium]